MRIQIQTVSMVVTIAVVQACGGSASEARSAKMPRQSPGAEAAEFAGSSAKAQDKGAAPLLFNLTSDIDDPHALYMALSLAGDALERGRPVVLFFNVHSVPLVATTGPTDLTFRGSPPLQQLVRERMEAGAVVLVCPHCMEATDVGEGELIDGARVASPATLFAYLDEDTAVFTY